MHNERELNALVVDLNAKFNIRQAQVQESKKGVDGKKFWTQTEHKDAYSVCEGEICFTINNRKQKSDFDRYPIELLSSLNGFCPTNALAVTTAIGQCHDAANPPAGAGAAAVIIGELQAYHHLRNEFFRTIRYSCTAVSNFDYRKVGHKGEQFVATMGGLNTIFTDTPITAGDTVIADIPAFDPDTLQNGTLQMASADCDNAQCKGYGLTTWKQKVGVPKSKRTLVVRSLPALPNIRNADYGGLNAANDVRRAYESFRQGFIDRGQVIGICVKSAGAGERIDLVHGHNAVGKWNATGNNFFPIV